MFDKRLIELCPESRKHIVANVLLQWVTLVCNAAMIAVFAVTIERFYTHEWGMAALPRVLVLITVTIVVRFFTDKLAEEASWCASKTVKRRLRDLIYDKLLRLGSRDAEQVSTAEIVQESVEGVDQLESYFGRYMPQFFYAFLAPITLFFLFGFAGSWYAATVLLVCVPLIPGAIVMVQKLAKKLLAKYWGQYTQLGNTFLENLQGMTTLKVYQADEFKNQEMNKESEHFRFITMKVLSMQLNSIIIMDFFAYGGAALGILVACHAFAAGSIGLASCLFMILLSADFFLPMRRLGSYFHVAMNGLAASDKNFHFLDLPEPKQVEKTIDENYTVVFDKVHFSYNTEREVLHGVSLRAPENSFIGIVGESGSGKSTLAALLMGRAVPQTGSVTVGGTVVTDVVTPSLMNTLTYISHSSRLFKGSVRENLLVAKRTATDTELWQVLEECELKDFLLGEQGLDTLILEEAKNLSGGQRQRLALARAILHNAPVLVLDEATSSIDIESEQVVLSRVFAMRNTKTIIMISHRLANIKHADCIYVLDGGNLVGSGTHEKLIKTCDVYEHLWRTQLELESYGLEAAQ